MFLFVIIIQLLSGAISQVEYSSAKPANLSQETHRIFGIVVDAQSAEVLPGVKVVLDDNKEFTYTNLDGEFELHLCRGSHKISVTHLAYESVELNQIIPSHAESIVISLKEQ
jgi:hypothetical protein